MSLDDLSVTAHHEAAHAVAVVMTGSTLVSVSIRSTRSRHGGTAWRGERCHAAFVAYAGAWAEARFQWRGHSLDALDDSGLSFDDHVTRVFLENTCDLWAYQQETGGSRSLIDEAVWRVFQPDYEVTTNRVVPQDLAWGRVRCFV
ncbi:hypothetical protein BST36_30365 [Mycolicibacterium moriokaense]|uniref:Uncharacterized protein n=1 Tax=Mycolicibacterium moriokaense TaxID=39691 RepID=A0AAD1HC19_9MYCO|nr:hypothetical protein [Mycolicibacterium moriokaense]MCV7039951.1 hypothetical protein [Mycolicibacterium moriokaense]ORB11544.1 hypothetical protein BST36_30365 [Mycolicibacterium moriokaense]BBX02279.1 hypothetical protein MMOR_32150 [Mycolicibacterium moriokaense]